MKRLSRAGRETVLPLLMTSLAPVLWSTGGLGVRMLDGLPVWEILFWRSVFMCLTLSVWGLVTRDAHSGRRWLKSVSSHALISICFALSFIFYIFSVTQTTVADSLLIQGTAPIFIVLFGWMFLREKIERITIISLLLAVLGILVIMLPSLTNGGLSGNLFGLAKAVAFACGTVAVRAKKSVGILPAMTTAAGLSALAALPMVNSFALDPQELLILIYLGVIQVGIGFILFVSWSGRLRSSQTGLIVILEAVLGPLWPWLVIGEMPSVNTLFGGLIIIIAIGAHAVIYSRPAVRSVTAS
jgi:drug/metabolite transporter, DME family